MTVSVYIILKLPCYTVTVKQRTRVELEFLFFRTWIRIWIQQIQYNTIWSEKNANGTAVILQSIAEMSMRKD